MHALCKLLRKYDRRNIERVVKPTDQLQHFSDVVSSCHHFPFSSALFFSAFSPFSSALSGSGSGSGMSLPGSGSGMSGGSRGFGLGAGKL